jgi:hypothetical protein
MRSAKQILREAREDGRVLIEGEMEFPYGITSPEAITIMDKIACDCGYMASHRCGTIRVSGPGIIGEYVLDWYDTTRPGPWKIEHWTAERASHPLFRTPEGGLTDDQAKSTTPPIIY